MEGDDDIVRHDAENSPEVAPWEEDIYAGFWFIKPIFSDFYNQKQKIKIK